MYTQDGNMRSNMVITVSMVSMGELIWQFGIRNRAAQNTRFIEYYMIKRPL